MDDERFQRIRELGGQRYAAWIAAGYREHWQDSTLKATPYLLQRDVRAADGVKLFFVDIWVYDTTDWCGHPGDAVSYHAEVQYDGHGDRQTFDVGLHRPAGPAEAEAFFLRLYEAMGCQPYGD